ncbi:MAG TPA: HAMP domain-containing protein, partial [Anaerolineaceae bacterium]|nr:HAMP domain-containing protein [Anaerolineaceae bacterium]
MKRSLQGKLIFSYLVIALITVLVVSALIRLTSGQSLMNLVMEQQTAMLNEAVQSYYTENATLDGFFDYYLQQNRRDNPPPTQPDGVPDKGPGMGDIRGVHGLVDLEYRALMPTFNYEIGQIVPADLIKQKIAVEVDGQTIAWILPDTSFQFKLSAEEQLFLKRTNLAIGLAALAGVLAAVAMGFFLSSRLLKPIRRLTQASQALAHGDLQQQVPVTSQDELGQLTATFNQMSADLTRADQQRKRLTADITHDLSTPLQIISGYIEMLEDGEVTLTPQRIDIIKTEIEHLRRLVGDMTTLTQVEAGALEITLQPVSPAALLQRIYQAYQP